MRVIPLGEAACLLYDLPVAAYRAAEQIRAANLPGVFDVSASYESVGVYFDPEVFETSSLSIEFSPDSGDGGTLHKIEVCYEMAPDLAWVASELNLSPEEVIAHHSAQPFRCYAVGFCPGFPYLGYLPDALSGIPRLPQPRVRTAPGSVAVTGRQTAIYPLVRPGGWPVIGLTPRTLVHLGERHFSIKAGDLVQFVPIDPVEFEKLLGTRI